MKQTKAALATFIMALATLLTAPLVQPLAAQQTGTTTGGMAGGMTGAASKGMGEGHNMKMSGWQELDRFHMILMQTWHPIKDKADVTPTRNAISIMVNLADALASSKAPKGCDTAELDKARAQLKSDTQALAKLIEAKADDKAVTEAMKGLHDRFEVLEEGCKPVK